MTTGDDKIIPYPSKHLAKTSETPNQRQVIGQESFHTTTNMILASSNTILHLATKFNKLRPDCSNVQRHAYILNLPLEVVLSIMELLPARSRTLASNVCSALRFTVLEHYPNNTTAAHLSDGEKVEFLYELARSWPDRWVCEPCHRFHTFDSQLDKPVRLMVGTPDRCPRDDDLPCQYSEHAAFWPRHHHVQLALKSNRLSSKDPIQLNETSSMLGRQTRKIRKQLSTPVYHQYYRDHVRPEVRCHSYPLIHDGRYLLKYVWRYVATSSRYQGRIGMEQEIDDLFICCHNFVPRLLGDTAPIDVAIKEATSSREATYGHCTDCPVDFKVEVRDLHNSRRTTRGVREIQEATITAWYDLGTGGTSLDRNERFVRARETIDLSPGAVITRPRPFLKIYCPPREGAALLPSGEVNLTTGKRVVMLAGEWVYFPPDERNIMPPQVEHEPQSIRKLYETCENRSLSLRLSQTVLRKDPRWVLGYARDKGHVRVSESRLCPKGNAWVLGEEHERRVTISLD